MGTTAVLPVSFRSQTASSSHPFAFLPPSPNTSPHKREFFAFFLSPDAAASPLSRPPCDNLNRGQECKRAAATMDSSSRTRSSPPLLLLPEDLIIQILLLHLEDRHGMAASRQYAGLRHVCAMFWRICDSAACSSWAFIST